MSKNEQRFNYETIKAWTLEAYFDFCRDRGISMNMTHLEVIGYVDYEFEGSFGRPIERLMFRVVELVLSGGWHEVVEKNMREDAVAIMTEHGLDTLLQGVPEDEAEAFKHDLRILKLV